MRHHFSVSVLILSLSLSFTVCHRTSADDKEAGETPYATLWSQVEQLLEDREYGSAADLIADAETDPDLASFKTQLATDRKDVDVLQRFAKLVKDQAVGLKAGAPLKVGAIDYTVVEFIDDAKGERLVLTTAKNPARVEKTLTELDYRTWIELTQSKLSTSAEDRYMLGVYLAACNGNRKEARQTLNLAAADGKSVSHWTARLDAEAQATEAAKAAKKAIRDDPVLGTWRIVIGDQGKPQRLVNSTFRADGRVIHTPVKADEKAPPAGTWR
ncbi:MAG: hypothetical protein AABP62_29395, partial [Planctomycetota bacterium]